MKPFDFAAVDALDDLLTMEALTVERATLAGCEIIAASGTISMVRHKTGARDAVSLGDQASEVDRRAKIRAGPSCRHAPKQSL